MTPPRCHSGAAAALGALAILILTAPCTRAAGITIVTHGLNGNVDDWIIPMAARIPEHPGFPGLDYSCYEIYFNDSGNGLQPTQRFLGGTAPADADTGEIFIKLDWRQLANNSYSTYQVAARVLPVLLDPAFIPDLGGNPIVYWPLHMIGHSRGGSLICELSRLLGERGVWVDQITTLDPHPLNNDGFTDVIYTVVDATATTYENVLFADNYYQTSDLLIYGEPILGAYVRKLTNLSGGYSGFGGAHSDVHLWYHGTIDLFTPADDSLQMITSAERTAWWQPGEESGARTGFYFSRLGGGDRLSTNSPAGNGTPRVVEGLNRVWEFGNGEGFNNRTRLQTNDGLWPNLIQCQLTGTNDLALGQLIRLRTRFQSAADTTHPVSFRFYLDADPNPINANEILLAESEDVGTGPLEVRTVSWEIPTAGITVPDGLYHLWVELAKDGVSRQLELDSLLRLQTVSPPMEPLTLKLLESTPASITLGVEGQSGLTAVVEFSADFEMWAPLATNILDVTDWVLVDSDIGQAPSRFYRAHYGP